MSPFTAQLRASRHMFTPTSEAAFGKGGILRLHFRKTGRQIDALTLEQMCRLFYLKRACDSSAAIWRYIPGVTEPKRKNTEEIGGKEGDKELF